MNTLPPGVEELVKEAFNCQGDAGGWKPLATVGIRLRQLDPSFTPQKYGAEKLVDLLSDLSHLVELKCDNTRYPHPPVYSGCLRPSGSPSTPSSAPPSRAPQPVQTSRQEEITFGEYCHVPNETINELADKTLEEKWYFGSAPPSVGVQHPILRHYLRYTFLRLRHEGKVLITTDKEYKEYSAFNTGLVDKRFEPIYALLTPNTLRMQPWFLSAFCVAGEGRFGKELVSNFNPLPQPAHYFDNPGDMFYDVAAGKPQVDWKHIIEDNVDRLPMLFIDNNGPKGFRAANTREMSGQELDDYKQSFYEALDADEEAYRKMIARLDDALDVALRRVRLNFKTAIPMYFPKNRRINLLLPLGLLRDNSIDLALVVERTQSGNYLGHTVLPLDWAYSNARVICRPSNDWLKRSDINVNQTVPSDSTDDESA